MARQILDIHTHHAPPQDEALVCITPDNCDILEVQWYSVAIHPWLTASPIASASWESLERLASMPNVKAIGECGIDKLKGGPLFMQMQAMKRHIELSERLRKPLVIHCVKAHDVIIGMKKDLKPEMPWVVHGFRGKPSVAKMLTDAGIFLSFGPSYNPDSLLAIPDEMILAETDEADTTIGEVIAALSQTKGEDLTGLIAGNSSRFLTRNI